MLTFLLSPLLVAGTIEEGQWQCGTEISDVCLWRTVTCDTYLECSWYKRTAIDCRDVDQCTVDCTGYGCSRLKIYCASDCTVHCDNQNACSSVTIISPDHSNTSINCTWDAFCWDGPCTPCEDLIVHSGQYSEISLTCSGDSACEDAAVHLASGSALDLQCDGNRGCYKLNVDGASNTTIDGYCTGCEDDRTCMGASINAGSDSSINIRCTGSSSCSSSGYACFSMAITGGSGTNIIMHCHTMYGCFYATIDGRDAALLTLKGCTDVYSCPGMDIWCPARVNGVKKCILYGTYGLGGLAPALFPLSLYAINGWKDIDFPQNTTKSSLSDKKSENSGFYGRMHCTNGWNEWCDFGANDEWACDDRNNTCQTGITNAPTKSPSWTTSSPSLMPTFSPSASPSKSPSSDPTRIPTYGPTAAPTISPSMSPSLSPTLSPTEQPLTLAQVMSDDVELQQITTGSQLTVYIVLGAGSVAVFTAFALMKWRARKQTKMVVDDQNYIALLVYLWQIVDIATDVLFTLQCRRYWLYGLEDSDDVVVAEDFIWPYRLAAIFVIVPYLMNLYSSINITRTIAATDSISEYSKQFFRDKSKYFTIFVLCSGGAVPALQLMSSNIFGSGMLSSGLSSIQIEHFRTHHVFATILAETVPQLLLGWYFLFKLDVVNSIVIISNISSVFNILLAIMSMVIFFILYRNQKEVPFTITVSWKRHGYHSTIELESISTVKDGLDPFTHCGRRKALSKALAAIEVDGGAQLKFEILSAQKHESSATIYGVFVTEQTVQSRARAQSEGDVFSKFMVKERRIKRAVFEALDLSEFRTKFVFSVSIDRTTSISPTEQADLILEGLRELNVSKSMVSAIERELNDSMLLQDAESVVAADDQAIVDGDAEISGTESECITPCATVEGGYMLVPTTTDTVESPSRCAVMQESEHSDSVGFE